MFEALQLHQFLHNFETFFVHRLLHHFPVVMPKFASLARSVYELSRKTHYKWPVGLDLARGEVFASQNLFPLSIFLFLTEMISHRDRLSGTTQLSPIRAKSTCVAFRLAVLRVMLFGLDFCSKCSKNHITILVLRFWSDLHQVAFFVRFCDFNMGTLWATCTPFFENS